MTPPLGTPGNSRVCPVSWSVSRHLLFRGGHFQTTWDSPSHSLTFLLPEKSGTFWQSPVCGPTGSFRGSSGAAAPTPAVTDFPLHFGLCSTGTSCFHGKSAFSDSCGCSGRVDSSHVWSRQVLLPKRSGFRPLGTRRQRVGRSASFPTPSVGSSRSEGTPPVWFSFHSGARADDSPDPLTRVSWCPLPGYFSPTSVGEDRPELCTLFSPKERSHILWLSDSS